MVKEDDKPFVEIFTDGACSGNPGVGGYGAIVRFSPPESGEKEISGCEHFTTNNRMELTAVIRALETLEHPCKVKIVTDSNYVVQGMTVWISRWKKNRWKNSRKQDVINQDLWKELLNLSEKHDIIWEWIRSHESHTENNRCDRLARLAIKTCKEDIINSKKRDLL